MKQIYHHYTLWEDYKHGMYNEDKNNRKKRVEQAVLLLSSPELCYQQMKRVTNEWIHASEQVLSDKSINHQAFLGQSACSIWKNIHEDETREAWGMLTNEQRIRANRIADRVDEEFQKAYEEFKQISMFEE